MKLTHILTRSLPVVLIGALAAGASLSAADNEPGSGFLDPAIESQMSEVKTSDGKKVMRWKSPEFTRENYSAVMIDRVIFYPAPSPGPQVSSRTLEQIADYLTDALRRELGKKVKVVETAGAGVLRMQPAITAVKVSTEGLSAKDIIPVHLLFTTVKTVAGKQTEQVVTAVEVRISDSVSGEDRAAAKRKIEGKPLQGEKDQLTLGDYRQALDEGAAAGATTLQEVLGQ